MGIGETVIDFVLGKKKDQKLDSSQPQVTLQPFNTTDVPIRPSDVVSNQESKPVNVPQDGQK